MDYKPTNPIKSQSEADQVFNYLSETTAKTLGISIVQAQKRVQALLNSGLLNSGHPDDPASQMKIDKFLSTPI